MMANKASTPPVGSLWRRATDGTGMVQVTWVGIRNNVMIVEVTQVGDSKFTAHYFADNFVENFVRLDVKA